MEIRFVYMTAGDAQEAAAIGRELVESRLAACVNILSPMRSIYRWKGNLEEDSETVLIAKTTRRRMPALIEKVRSLHSYACPCIVSLPVLEGHTPFLEWVKSQVSDDKS